MEQAIQELIKKNREELKQAGFDFYSLIDKDGIILFITYSIEKKRFVVTVYRSDPVEILISVPVALTVAESKCDVVFGREFKSFLVYEGDQEGDIRLMKSPKVFIEKDKSGQFTIEQLLECMEGNK